MTSFFPQTQGRVKFTSFPSFPCVLEGILEAEIFPTQAQGVLKQERLPDSWKPLSSSRKRHGFIQTKNQYQRRWKAPENKGSCHGGHDLRTPTFHLLWVSVCGVTDPGRQRMDSESCETPVCCCVCLGVFMCCKPPCAPPRGAVVVRASLSVQGELRAPSQAQLV